MITIERKLTKSVIETFPGVVDFTMFGTFKRASEDFMKRFLAYRAEIVAFRVFIKSVFNYKAILISFLFFVLPVFNMVGDEKSPANNNTYTNSKIELPASDNFTGKTENTGNKAHYRPTSNFEGWCFLIGIIIGITVSFLIYRFFFYKSNK